MLLGGTNWLVFNDVLDIYGNFDTKSYLNVSLECLIIKGSVIVVVKKSQAKRAL